jgi:hypothetical protein
MLKKTIKYLYATNKLFKIHNYSFDIYKRNNLDVEFYIKTFPILRFSKDKYEFNLIIYYFDYSRVLWQNINLFQLIEILKNDLTLWKKIKF